MTTPFIVAVAMLGVAVFLAGPVAKRLDVKHAKLPLPLQAPLAALDEEAIAPYRVLERLVLEPTTLEALGTSSYLNWIIEDNSVSRNDPLRFANLFVTYDTGGRNLVPHRPDVCYLGAGYEPAQRHENIEIELTTPVGSVAKLPLRVCTFVQTALRDRHRETVIYTFHCNGRFVATRTGVRVLINDLTNTYNYFSKVEVKFPNASRVQSIEGAKRLLSQVLPVLSREHWPDFEAAEAEARRSAAKPD